MYFGAFFEVTSDSCKRDSMKLHRGQSKILDFFVLRISRWNCLVLKRETYAIQFESRTLQILVQFLSDWEVMDEWSEIGQIATQLRHSSGGFMLNLEPMGSYLSWCPSGDSLINFSSNAKFRSDQSEWLPGGGQPLLRTLRCFECQSAQLGDCIGATSKSLSPLRLQF